MSNVSYIKGDIFELAPKGEYIAHAVNCQGVWGSGIAEQFRKKYPESYREYVNYCLDWRPDQIIGESYETRENVVCLFTSKDYGGNKDGVDKIVLATRSALKDFLEYREDEGTTIYMPKINSGLFGVPWHKTEAVLKEFDGQLNFVVYEKE